MKTRLAGISVLLVALYLSLAARAVPIFESAPASLIDPSCGSDTFSVLKENLTTLQAAFARSEITLEERNDFISDWSDEWNSAIDNCIRELRLRTIRQVLAEGAAEGKSPAFKAALKARLSEDLQESSSNPDPIASMETLGFYSFEDEAVYPDQFGEGSEQYLKDARSIRKNMSMRWDRALNELVHGVERVD